MLRERRRCLGGQVAGCWILHCCAPSTLTSDARRPHACRALRLAGGCLLAALLHKCPHELLGVRFEYTVDFVEEIVHALCSDRSLCFRCGGRCLGDVSLCLDVAGLRLLLLLSCHFLLHSVHPCQRGLPVMPYCHGAGRAAALLGACLAPFASRPLRQ